MRLIVLSYLKMWAIRECNPRFQLGDNLGEIGTVLGFMAVVGALGVGQTKYSSRSWILLLQFDQNPLRIE